MKLKILIVILSVILVCLLAVVPFIPKMNRPEASGQLSSLDSQPSESSERIPPTSQEIVTSAGQIMTSQPATSQPATQPPAPAVTQPASKPPEQPSGVAYSDDPTANAFYEEKLTKWTCPVKDEFGEVVGSRTFASSRGGGKRAHAGLDFVAPHGTKVYAITSGTVQRVAMFYQNTWAVEVKNDDGSVLRYCEIATELETGDRVEQGDIIGTILRADSGTEMVHMEVYYGNGEGMLTQTGNKTFEYVDNTKNFQRRSDLLDPTFLKDLPKG